VGLRISLSATFSVRQNGFMLDKSLFELLNWLRNLYPSVDIEQAK
jgi:hypothetical protein